MADIWIEEFLYRGRPPSGPGSEEPPAWHIVIGAQEVDPLNPDAYNRSTRIFNMEQAGAAGYDLPKILSGISADVLAEVENLRAAKADLEAQAESLQSQVTALQGGEPS